MTEIWRCHVKTRTWRFLNSNQREAITSRIGLFERLEVAIWFSIGIVWCSSGNIRIQTNLNPLLTLLSLCLKFNVFVYLKRAWRFAKRLNNLTRINWYTILWKARKVDFVRAWTNCISNSLLLCPNVKVL